MSGRQAAFARPNKSPQAELEAPGQGTLLGTMAGTPSVYWTGYKAGQI